MITNNQNVIEKILHGKIKELSIRSDCRNALRLLTGQIDHVRLNEYKVIEIKHIVNNNNILYIILGDVKDYFVLRRGRPRDALQLPKAYAKYSFCYDGDPICNFSKGDEIKYKFSLKRIGRVYIYRNDNFIAGMDSNEFNYYFGVEKC